MNEASIVPTSLTTHPFCHIVNLSDPWLHDSYRLNGF